MDQQPRTVADLVVETVRAAGVDTIFGLPGSTTGPLLHAISRQPGLRFVLGKHESTAIAMAEGYARATGRLAVAIVYNVAGVANSLTTLYDAHKNRTPILVLASQQYMSLRGVESVVDGEPVPLVSELARFAIEVWRPERVADSLIRAMKRALSPPAPGPALVALPFDLLEEPAPDAPAPVLDGYLVSARSAGDPAQAQRIARRLAEAEWPLIVAGGQVGRHGAVPELVELAEKLAAPVAYEVHFQDRLGFPPQHPYWIGDLHPRHPLVRRADFVLAVGARVHHELDPSPEPILPPHARLAQINLEPDLIANRYPVDAGLVADPRLGLRQVLDLVDPLCDDARIARRAAELRDHAERAGRRLDEFTRDGRDAVPMNTWHVVDEIARAAGDDAILVSELTTCQRALYRFHRTLRHENYFADTGVALGWGLGAAIGIKIARPRDKVICCIGDGAHLFGIAGLWTIANYDVGLVTVVFNNGGYWSTRYFTEARAPGLREAGNYPGGDFADDPTDFARIAEGFGVPGVRIARLDELGPAIERGLASPRGIVIDVPVSRDSAIFTSTLPRLFPDD